MSTQMIIRLDLNTKKKFTNLAQAEGKNISKVMRELIENYINERDMGTYIDDLWGRIGSKIKSSGADLDTVIHNARNEKK